MRHTFSCYQKGGTHGCVSSRVNVARVVKVTRALIRGRDVGTVVAGGLVPSLRSGAESLSELR